MVVGGEGSRLLLSMLVYITKDEYRRPDCEMYYLYTSMLTCIIVALYSLEFHAYTVPVSSGTCSIVSGHGGVGCYSESPRALSATVPHVAW
jgi:hypothetical protein